MTIARRRFTEHKPAGSPAVLAADHGAVVESRTRYPRSVIWPGLTDPVLKSGIHNRKIGDRVTKGAWAGMPIYTLTLEERATCPRACRNWRNCYGNKMPFADRHMPGEALERCLDTELNALARRHPGGFVVRLHVLGDFYSVNYVRCWAEWLATIPELHVFGYSAWASPHKVHKAICLTKAAFPHRFCIRFSNQGLPSWGAETTEDTPLFGAAGSPQHLRGLINLPGGLLRDLHPLLGHRPQHHFSDALSHGRGA